jgi:hypothetical protein
MGVWIISLIDFHSVKVIGCMVLSVQHVEAEQHFDGIVAM